MAYPRHTIYINAPALICVKKASLQDLTAADIMVQKKILHRSKEGSAKMILDSQELEFLKLCALARYMPCGLAGIFEMQILKSEVSGRLAKSGYLK